jgi:hypothetical protein
VYPIARVIRSRGGFQRRRDLRALGYTDAALRAALAAGTIFRVRHGWYAVPDAPEAAIRAVRVGGRLTGVAALETYGLRVPRRPRADLVVPRGAARLRSPENRRARLVAADGIRVHWVDGVRRGIPTASWRVSVDDALLLVLQTEGRDVAVAVASAVARYKKWSANRMDAVFARAPARARAWRDLVGWTDDAHGETFVRLWLRTEGIPWESQPYVAGVGWLDGRVGPNCYVEVDGGQHDAGWTGPGESTFEKDHDRDTTMATLGKGVLRFTYRQLYADWPRCVAAINRMRLNDLELMARRRQRPVPPRGFAKKLRKSELELL